MIRIGLQMVRANLLQMVRDKRAMIFTLLMPMVLIAILSFALSDLFGGKPIPKFEVGVYNADQGVLSSALLKSLRSNPNQMTVVQEQTHDAGENQLNDGSIDVFVFIPRDFSQQVLAGKSMSIDVQSTLNNDTKRQVVEGYATAFGKQVGLQRYAFQSLGPKGVSANAASLGNLSFKTKTIGIHPITSGSYYVVGMMTMFLLMASVNYASRMVDERNSDKYKRLMASPASRQALLFGHFLTAAVFICLQGMILLAMSRLLLGITVGPVGQSVLLIACYAIALAGISVLLGTFIRNEQVINGFSAVGTNILAVLGGSIFPLYGFPAFIRALTHVIPNGIALNSFLNTVSGIQTSFLLTPALTLIFIGIGLGLISGVRYGRTA